MLQAAQAGWRVEGSVDLRHRFRRQAREAVSDSDLVASGFLSGRLREQAGREALRFQFDGLLAADLDGFCPRRTRTPSSTAWAATPRTTRSSSTPGRTRPSATRSRARPGPKSSSVWSDFTHSKSRHQQEIGTQVEHTLAMLGVEHGAAIATCGSCHLTKTAKAGAGRFGFLMGAPAGTDDDITCFESDIHAHVFDVPRRSAVRGTPPPPCA